MFDIQKQRIKFFVFMIAVTGIVSCTGPSSEDFTQNKETGQAFLMENKTKEGIKTTSSGLQYAVLKEGTGKTPGPTSKVSVNYRGTLISGEEFDRADNISFPVNQVIPGWTEGLQLMKEGASYRLFIPSELAYGERGAGTAIQPNQALIFVVDLIKVD